MPKRKILVLDREESPWPSFLEEFFNDTPSSLEVVRTAGEAGYQLTEKPQHYLFFFKEGLLSPTLIQKLKALQTSNPNFRVFQIESMGQEAAVRKQGCEGMAHGAGYTEKKFFHSVPLARSPGLVPDASFREPLIFLDFQSELVTHLSFPDALEILLVDDETEIHKMLIEFLRQKSNPKFSVVYAGNGKAALQAIARKKPDVMILDIKMPEMGGQEVYHRVVEQKMGIPVIVFFDAIFGDEIMELHKIGSPAIVEKGSQESTIPNLTALILKMAYFA